MTYIDELIKVFKRKFTAPILNILVLGFYDRGNAGDEMYKTAFRHIFKNDRNVQLTFKCTDDVDKIPSNTDIVICGGGDIINEYFMTKIMKLLKHFTGPIYAVSVGIPFANSTKYLDIFDHVFVRNKRDYHDVKEYLGERNTTYLPDLGFIFQDLPNTINIKPSTIDHKLGICLAQPVFVHNPNLFQSMAKCLVEIMAKYTKLTVYFYSFNSFTQSFKECDIFCAEKVISLLPPILQLRCKIKEPFPDPMLMFQDMQSMNFIIAMRYHSVVFSLVNNIPFLALYKSKKVDTLLDDFGLLQTNQRIDDDIAIKEFLHLFDEQFTQACTNKLATPRTQWYFNCIRERILSKKLQNILIRHQMNTFDQSLFTTMKSMSSYLNMDKNTFDKILYSKAPLNLKGKDPLHVARLICYSLTGNISHPCIWGLKDNITSHSFVLYDALKYIFTVTNQNTLPPRIRFYYPTIKIPRKHLLNVDPYFTNDFRGLHRSGWSYVVDHLMNLDAKHIGRTGTLLVDTYVDRTFHWGMETMKAMGMLPYTSPWIGFIHHTFDTTHSPHNCVQLFENELFLQSLDHCHGIVVLSNYLANQIRTELNKREIDVKTHVIYHPTEHDDNMFTMSKFKYNKDKQIVNIGAWLRKPYSIFQLDLNKKNNHLNITKSILKGKEMDGYFRPPSLFDDLHSVLVENNPSSSSSCVPCRDVTNNKYCIGLYAFLKELDKSVRVLNNLSNQEYDQLLSENIAFLDLVDCSAVNTVVECIVRNTPIIVNRHPALEEVLGSNYPGFYSYLHEVPFMINDMHYINNIYKHIQKLNKGLFHINEFMLKFKAIIDSVDLT